MLIRIGLESCRFHFVKDSVSKRYSLACTECQITILEHSKTTTSVYVQNREGTGTELLRQNHKRLPWNISDDIPKTQLSLPRSGVSGRLIDINDFENILSGIFWGDD